MIARVLLALAIIPLGASAGSPAGRGATPAIERTFYETGAPAAERSYVNGREEGRHMGWWENGTIKFVYHYHDGVMEGVAREWFSDGRLYRETHYRAGQEEGLQRMWWPDGTLRASYVVRDGRRYGVLGAKGCVAADSSQVRP